MGGVITDIMTITTDNDYSLARDLIGLALADGKITEEEKAAIARICQLDNITEDQLKEMFKSSDQQAQIAIPTTRKEKEDYLVKMIQVMGADGDSATEEIFLLEIMAGRLGFSRLQLTALVLLNATRKNFPGDFGAKVLSTFLKNIVDPKGKSNQQNHDNIAKIYDAVANTTILTDDAQENQLLLREAFAKATQTLLANELLAREFQTAGLNFREILESESIKALGRQIQLLQQPGDIIINRLPG